MITAITYQHQISRKYHNPCMEYAGNETTDVLEEVLNNDAEMTKKIYRLVQALNTAMIAAKLPTDEETLGFDNISSNLIRDYFKLYLGSEPRVSNVTKKTRRYSLCGLTVHEKDI